MDGVVSILVLMDVVREVNTLGFSILDYPGFNPCSNGCRSGSNVRVINPVILRHVSILVLMDVVREDRDLGVLDRNLFLFQSLF